MINRYSVYDEIFSSFKNVRPAGTAMQFHLIGNSVAKLTENEIKSLNPQNANRLLEFSYGRLCAKLAIKELLAANDPDIELISKDTGEPCWPAEFVGSITHKEKLCAAIVGKRTQFHSIGIDIEITGQKDLGLLEKITLKSERGQLQNTLRSEADSLNALFSAKEAFYKYQYPLFKLDLDFQDVEIKMDFNNNVIDLVDVKCNRDVLSDIRTSGPKGIFRVIHGHSISCFFSHP